ncbi:hypothetical protein A141_12315 [Vibrio crassostreae ZF-91]|nr:hypothetical protein A141_12315 [Vibrio crassostreae ZF-91]
MKKSEQISSREHSLQLQKKLKRKTVGSHKDIKKNASKYLLGHPIVQVPRELDLIEGSCSICHNFFDTLRDVLKGNPKRIYLDFRLTTMLKAMPLLVMYSIIDEAREEDGVESDIRVMWSKRKGQVNRVIEFSGKFASAAEREEQMHSSSTLPIIMGDNARANDLSNAFVDYILEKYYPDADAEKEQEISSAIQETVDNVGRHAYPDVEDHSRKRWWFSCHRIGDNLYIVIYDRGVGIPNSLSKNNAVFLSRINNLYPDEYKGATNDTVNEDMSKLDSLKAWFQKNLTDGQLIRAAMHTNVTSTDLDQHGQGSRSIKALISDHENSYLLMFSNYGFYCYDNDREDNEKSVDNTTNKLTGTLIQWSI